MAEENSGDNSTKSSDKKPIVLYALVVINMLVVAAVGFMLFQNRKKEAAEPKIENVIKNEAEQQEAEKTAETNATSINYPLETFIFNIAGTRGTRVGKINMEMEIEGEGIKEEFEKRKANIRDNIILILSSKTYEELADREGKEQLKSEIQDRLNSFLVKGKVKAIFFTEYIYN